MTKKTQTGLKDFIGWITVILIIQLVSVPFYLLGDLKWGLSVGSIILFLVLVRIAFVRNK